MNSERISSKKRAELTALAQGLDPVVRIGTDGVSDALVRSVEEAFNTRELIKVKVLEGAPVSSDEAGRAIAARIEHVQLVRSVGRVVILYRPAERRDTKVGGPDKAKRRSRP